MRGSDAGILDPVVRVTLLIHERLAGCGTTRADGRVVFNLGDAAAPVTLVLRLKLLVRVGGLSFLNHSLVKEILLFQVLIHLVVILLIVDVVRLFSGQFLTPWHAC